MSHPHQGYDEDELAISLATGNTRNTQTRPSEPGSGRNGHHDGGNPGSRTVVQTPPKSEQRIGAYHIIKTLGEGSFGKVKLAVHRDTGNQVALKIIARKKLISRDMAGRVEREIEYLQLLRHPHIIKLYTVIKTPQEIVMVLEYAGGELFDYIVQHGKMSEEKARRFFQQIICAVEYCHRHKIVHRDLKPENLLLDTDLNVKIADFGLSNIMTDGNFLKTSCGSPNYAAPEVINGKLYAGPEVDVWSCGVILYVLLVGRLPFDDEHIPTLFAKIAKGHYVVPSYMGVGAAALIKKMLSVSPTNRASIQEIREDPWFRKDLPAYLKPPIEEFIDTGVDPAKAINFRSIAPHAPLIVQQKMHDDLIVKVSKTMGYGKKDVEEALTTPEPSAIKDAYLIVRENKIMAAINEHTPGYPGASSISPASSPPVFNNHTVLGGSLGSPTPASPPAQGVRVEQLSPTNEIFPGTLTINSKRPTTVSPSSHKTSNSSNMSSSVRPYTSKIGILPSSLPAYHRAYMESLKKGASSTTSSSEEVRSDEPHHGRLQTDAEQAENVRRLKPHSRSQLRLEEAKNKPTGMTPVPAKKVRPTKWQFGIRSRNQPLEAMGCIYRALKKLGAEWINDEAADMKFVDSNGSFDRNEDDGNDSEGSDGESLHHTDHHSSQESNRKNISFTTSSDGQKYKLPADPWVLHVRWRQTGIAPPGTHHLGSTNSSTAELRRQSVASLSSTGSTSADGIAGAMASVKGKPKDFTAKGKDHVVMHMDIQLYEMEQGVYLVDFKCVGYETEDGVLLEEKEVTSPFPFLDLASQLIIQLAEAD